MSTLGISLSPAQQPPAARSSPRIRVLIADETSMGCQLLQNALTRSRFRFEIVASATSCPEVLKSLRATPADVAVVSGNLRAGAFEGFRALNELRISFPDVRVVVLLQSATRDLVIDAFRAGAEGVVCRTEPIHMLCKCIQTVNDGQIWANSQQLRSVLDTLVNCSPLRVISSSARSVLSPKERGVANLVAEGLANQLIAKKLGVAEHTVDSHISRMYAKLNISSRVELALYVLSQKHRVD